MARTVAISLLIPLALLAVALAIPPAAPPPLIHIAERFGSVDWTGLPTPRPVEMRDGERLAIRTYEGGENVLILLHGSGGSGTAMHPLAMAARDKGWTVIVPDIRGHGESGRRGDVDYAGQVADDLDDLMAWLKSEHPGARFALAGFSMGGGLALRWVGSGERAAAFSRVVLLSPYLAHDAPPMAADNPLAPETPSAAPSIPRIIGLSVLNGLGLRALDHLQVVALGARPEDTGVARGYTWRLLTSVNPGDWRAEIAALAAAAPVTVLVGARDELHHAPAYAEALAGSGAELVTVPDLDHMDLILDLAGVEAALAALGPG